LLQTFSFLNKDRPLAFGHFLLSIISSKEATTLDRQASLREDGCHLLTHVGLFLHIGSVIHSLLIDVYELHYLLIT
jgi:hypothetical protein